MKRLGRVVSILLVLIGGTAPSGALQVDDCLPFEVGPPGCIEGVAWQSIIDTESLVIHRLPLRAFYVDVEGNRWQAQFTPFCRDNVNGTTIIDDGLCYGALTICKRYGADDLAGMFMVITPLFIGPPAQLEGPICFGESSKIQLGPIIEDLVEVEIGADPPPITLQPADAIVNLPMIASTDDRPPISIDISVPIVGTATATPEFLWTFAEGAVAHGPGRPYDGTSPTQNPGYYITHTYQALGTPTVGLTVTWRVTFTIPGYPPVDLTDVVRESTATTTIRSAGSELIGG